MAADTKTNTRARVSVTISKDFMAASVLLRAPQDDDAKVTAEEVMHELDQAEVVFGINEEAIRTAVTNCEYNTPLKVATGRMPERGADSSFIYHFDTSQDHKPKEDEDGHIDYRDISFIQNTETDAVLATKVPPTPGSPGMSVKGKELKGPDGRDLPFNNGVNTHVSDDGLSLVATVAGAIQYQFNKVSVMDVIAIKGDVDHTVGNIDCRGSVRVSGGIKAGFTLKIDGDLEVNGNVEDADIHVKGNIMIKGGCFGDREGIIEAGGDITVKFVEGQRLIAGKDVNVGGEIINCNVVAGEKVLIKGRRGKIVGGTVRARREIRAAVLGSEAGTATELQVAYDPDLMRKYHEVVKESQRIAEDGQRVKEALYVLYRLQMDGKLPDEKKAAMEKLELFQKELPDNQDALKQRKAEIEKDLEAYASAVIICEEHIHTGVKAFFGIVYREIVGGQDRCKLQLDGGKVLISEWRGDS